MDGKGRSTAEPLRREFALLQIAECWADNRNYDAILWQIPAAIGAIAGLMVNAIFLAHGSGVDAWVRPFIALAAGLITFPLVMALLKNRLFQIERNIWRAAVFQSLYADGVSASQLIVQARSDEDPRLARILFRESQRSASPDDGTDLVPFSSLHLDLGRTRGSSLFRLLATRFGGRSAYSVLLFVSVIILLSEAALFVTLLATRLAQVA